MSVAENKACLEHFVQYFNKETLDQYLEIYAPDVVLHGYPPDLPPGFEGVRAFYTAFVNAFPDSTITVNLMVGEGDYVACHFTMRATHKGEFLGVSPTGKTVEMAGQTILRFDGDRCVERWNIGDLLGLLQLLGAAPGGA